LQVNIKNLVDDVQCYQTVRELRWPDGVESPSCQSTQVIKRGLSLGFFELVHNARKRGKALLGALLELLVTAYPGIQYERGAKHWTHWCPQSWQRWCCWPLCT
jgi:hypothetical protein